jgi:4,5-dihydroxyphthalate decarboxylase
LRNYKDIGWLFDDPQEAATEYYRKSKIFPIMHILGVRRELAERHRWLPKAVFKAFSESKELAIERLEEMSACKITMPFVDERLQKDRALMGQDFWSYGIDKNKHVLNSFFAAHHAQGLSKRVVAIDEMFHESMLESFRI